MDAGAHRTVRRGRFAIAIALLGLLATVASTSSATAAEAPPTKALVPPPPAPNLAPYPEPARSTASTAKLLSDASSTEKLFAAAKSGDPTWAELGLRLGLQQLQVAASARADAAAATSDPDRLAHRQIGEKALARATETLRIVVDRAETFSRLDEVLYYLGRSYAVRTTLVGDGGPDARRLAAEAREKELATYLELIKRAPKSKLAEWAYIAYGDKYFDDAAAGKVDWRIALDAYERVLSAGRDPDAYGYVQYRLGFVEWHRDRKVAAIIAFSRAKEFAEKHPGAKGAAELALASTQAIIALRRPPAVASTQAGSAAPDLRTGPLGTVA